MATTKENLLARIEELKHELLKANAQNSLERARVENLKQTVAELEERADAAYKESETIIRMLKDAADNAENFCNQFIENTGEFTVADAVYNMQIIYRTVKHFYDPKTNQDEE